MNLILWSILFGDRARQRMLRMVWVWLFLYLMRSKLHCWQRCILSYRSSSAFLFLQWVNNWYQIVSENLELHDKTSVNFYFLCQVVLGLYALLFRTAIVEARRQVSKTRSFVAMIPVHVLTREVRCPCWITLRCTWNEQIKLHLCWIITFFLSAHLQETETIMHFFLPNGFDEDIAEAGGPASGWTSTLRMTGILLKMQL